MTASQMRCPRHFKDATLEIVLRGPNTLCIEIFTCCDDFEKRVREALKDDLCIPRGDAVFEMEGCGTLGITTGRFDSSQRADQRAA
jgi:hypothetical protein